MTTTEPAEPTNIIPLLSINEQAALLECEDRIRRGLKSFVEMGTALKRIRDSKLYRAKFQTFEQYCEVTWDISDRRARQLWAAAAVVGLLADKKFDAVPATESQARPLTELPLEEQPQAWEEVLRTAIDGKVTANHVAAVVERRLERLNPTAAAPTPPAALAAVKPPIDVPDLSTREQRITILAADAKVKLMALADAIGTADGIASANVFGSIHSLDELQEHLVRKAGMLDNRKTTRTKTEVSHG
jgi:hypothetical protein